MLNKNAFHRPKFAEGYCDNLSGEGFINATSGLFLAAPRRVGKTTFLIQDLIPEAKKRNWVSVYIDLWLNREADPGSLIIESIKLIIAENESKFSKLKKKVQLRKIKVLGTFEINLAEPGLPENVTLFHLIKHLNQKTKKPVLLMVDEAQHALTTKSGLNAMFALKSARDQLNTVGESPNLMLVFTGSNRDKLAQLVLKKDQPFYGADITSFPLLDRSYTNHLTENVNQALAKDNQFEAGVVWEAFRKVGYRPEVLNQLIGEAAISNQAESFSQLLTQNATDWHSHIWQEYEDEYERLPRLQKAVLNELAKEGRDFSPFSEFALEAYKESLEQDTPPPTSTIQTAIQSLRTNGFIWQSSRGAYALEDDSFGEWLKKHKLTLTSIAG